MNAPRILVIVGTPLPDSLVHALADSSVTGAREAGAEVRVVDLARDEIPGHPTERNELRAPRDTNDRPLDLTVAAYVDSLAWAEHVVFVYPQWWGTYPAALKAFVDRVFLANTAFRYRPARKLFRLSERCRDQPLARDSGLLRHPHDGHHTFRRGAAPFRRNPRRVDCSDGQARREGCAAHRAP